MWGAWGSAIQNWGYTQYLYGTVINWSFNSILNTNIW